MRFSVVVPIDVRIAAVCGDASRKVHAMNPATADDHPPLTRCAYAWCVTPHGRTVHPADEDHRSAGVGLTIRTRDGWARGAVTASDLEIGVLRRQDDDATWIVIEAGGCSSFALPVDDADEIGRRLVGESRRARMTGDPEADTLKS